VAFVLSSMAPHSTKAANVSTRRRRKRRCRQGLAGICVLAATGPARAEGTSELGTTQALRAGTTLGLDVLAANETFTWTGTGSVEVYGPSTAHLQTLTSGQTASAAEGLGVYTLYVNATQSIGSPWGVTVSPAPPRSRLFSRNWQFNAGSFASSASTNASFYALVEQGDATNLAVIELKLDGLAGYIYDINANRRGVNGPNAGRSVPEAGNTVTPEYRIYLGVPEVANFQGKAPVVSAFGYVGGVDQDVFGNPMTPCHSILPGDSQGYFSFTSATSGSYQLQCDLDADGDFDIGSGTDLLLLGTASVGTNVVSWDGRHNGAPIDPGVYQCRVRVTIGEFHYVGRDIETSYSGLRLYRVDQAGGRAPLSMYWNDSLVQYKDALMPNGAYGLVGSEGAVNPGAYASAAVPNVNARSWGNFTGAGKGNESFLDTYVWLDEDVSAAVELKAADASDADADGLTDYQEECLVGSSPQNPDTDADGTADGAQYAVPAASAFSGLESNGRMATALAVRAMRATRLSLSPSAAAVLRQQVGGPSAYLPDEVDGGAAVSDTPDDLVGLTNATSVAGADYVTSEGRRRGGGLVISTTSEFYEHQKGVCDRVRGGRLLDVRMGDLHGVHTFESTVSLVGEGRLEYSTTLYLWEDVAAGRWVPSTFWVAEGAPKVAAGARALTLQAWGDSAEFTRHLLSGMVARIEAERPIAWPVAPTPVRDEDYVDPPPAGDALPAAEAPALAPPSVLLEQGATLGGRLDLTLRRTANAGDVTLRFTRVAENGLTESSHVAGLEVSAQSERLSFEPGRFLEVTVDVLDGGTVVDRAWFSDGTWAPFDDGLWQAPTGEGTFSRTDCAPRDVADGGLAAEGAVRLAGCARTSLTSIGSFGGVARTFVRPLDLSQARSLAYYAKVDRGYDLCVEGVQGRACIALPASPSGGFVAVPIDAFGATPGPTSFISFASHDRSLEMEISALTLLTQPADSRPVEAKADDSGCALVRQSPARPARWGVWLSLAAGALALLRRSRRTPGNRGAVGP
jgi:hypothetical protein